MNAQSAQNFMSTSTICRNTWQEHNAPIVKCRYCDYTGTKLRLSTHQKLHMTQPPILDVFYVMTYSCTECLTGDTKKFVNAVEAWSFDIKISF